MPSTNPYQIMLGEINEYQKLVCLSALFNFLSQSVALICFHHKWDVMKSESCDSIYFFFLNSMWGWLEINYRAVFIIMKKNVTQCNSLVTDLYLIVSDAYIRLWLHRETYASMINSLLILDFSCDLLAKKNKTKKKHPPINSTGGETTCD